SNERIRVKQLESGERVRLKEISSNERIKMKQLESEESNREQEDRIKSVVVVLKEENLPAAARAGIASMEIER
ncbi:hypothetical protein, partial [Bacillus hominis]|uniref:hypothetical protein n=1 Tax=Bacillus hominis TaxID=2817478 RepID=UPI001BB360D0